MSRARSRATSGFRPKLHSRAESLSLESLDIRSGKSGHESRQGHAASGFRPKLHSRAESLSLQSLDMSRVVGRESLDMPKFGRESLDITKFDRESLDMGHKSLDIDFRDPWPDFGDQILVCPDFRDPCPDFRDQNLVCPDFCGPRRDSYPDFPDSNSRRDYSIWV